MSRVYNTNEVEQNRGPLIEIFINDKPMPILAYGGGRRNAPQNEASSPAARVAASVLSQEAAPAPQRLPSNAPMRPLAPPAQRQAEQNRAPFVEPVERMEPRVVCAHSRAMMDELDLLRVQLASAQEELEKVESKHKKEVTELKAEIAKLKEGKN